MDAELERKLDADISRFAFESGLPTRARRAVCCIPGVDTVRDFVALERCEVQWRPNCGVVTMRQIEDALQANGLALCGRRVEGERLFHPPKPIRR